jgi:hypothetical protein
VLGHADTHFTKGAHQLLLEEAYLEVSMTWLSRVLLLHQQVSSAKKTVCLLDCLALLPALCTLQAKKEADQAKKDAEEAERARQEQEKQAEIERRVAVANERRRWGLLLAGALCACSLLVVTGRMHGMSGSAFSLLQQQAKWVDVETHVARACVQRVAACIVQARGVGGCIAAEAAAAGEAAAGAGCQGSNPAKAAEAAEAAATEAAAACQRACQRSRGGPWECSQP